MTDNTSVKVEKIRVLLRKKFEEEINNNLTNGREEQESGAPYTEEQVLSFIKKNSKKIDNIIKQMINDYQEDEELDELLEPCDDWIREYLFDDIEFPTE